MLVRLSSFRLLGIPAFLFLTLMTDMPLRKAPGAPAPKPKPYALLYIPKQGSLYETNHYRRRQIALVKTNNTTAPFVLFWAIRSLKNADLPSLPKKGKGGETRFNHVEDVAWLEQHLQIEYLDGTGALRIALNAGSPREQALLVNAVVHAYFRLEVGVQKQNGEIGLELTKTVMEMEQKLYEMSNGEVKKNAEQSMVDLKTSIKRCEDALRNLPRILELADVPPK